MAKIISSNILIRFRTVMKGEIQIRCEHDPRWSFGKRSHILDSSAEFFNIAARLFEIAKSSTVPRSYNAIYNLCTDTFFYESVSAHTNLVSAIATEALDFCYGYDFGGLGKESRKTVDGYSYRDIMDTVRLHDIAENKIGDLPDNGSRDEKEKNQKELAYLEEYLETFSRKEKDLKMRILGLFLEMQNQTSPTGKLIYLADKVAALLITLCLDSLGRSPMMLENSIYVSKRDWAEMEKCEFSVEHAHKASEMWAIDFFQMREIVKYDENFFFTALIVMATLMVNDKWYGWREADY